MQTQQAQPVAEIVNFKLNAGIEEAAFLDLIKRTHVYASACSGFLSRNLSQATDGTWTDHILWASMPDAQAAAAGFMEQDFGPEMAAALDEASVRMRHQEVKWQSG